MIKREEKEKEKKTARDEMKMKRSSFARLKALMKKKTKLLRSMFCFAWCFKLSCIHYEFYSFSRVSISPGTVNFYQTLMQVVLVRVILKNNAGFSK